MNPLSVVVRTICDIFAWFMGIFGAYIIIHGHLTPAGASRAGQLSLPWQPSFLSPTEGKRCSPS